MDSLTIICLDSSLLYVVNNHTYSRPRNQTHSRIIPGMIITTNTHIIILYTPKQ